jgi:hypothetical protein
MEGAKVFKRKALSNGKTKALIAEFLEQNKSEAVGIADDSFVCLNCFS